MRVSRYDIAYDVNCWLSPIMAGTRSPIECTFTLHNVFPHLGETDSWISLTAIMTSF